MLRKSLLNLLFVLLFALVQAGIVTHEISHFQNFSHSQPDKNTTSEHCAQCLTMAHADGALPISSFSLQLAQAQPHWSDASNTFSPSAHRSVYAARAPPLFMHA